MKTIIKAINNIRSLVGFYIMPYREREVILSAFRFRKAIIDKIGKDLAQTLVQDGTIVCLKQGGSLDEVLDEPFKKEDLN